ncbi:hypothetical protein DAPPUDRAFT_301710 [Daphnia pulex]|uniref:Uncharacterized protein n=1 Tax=Daphnia pulex TaxID=6669 RepID=E9HJP7_DAPPU|nr:hypothetical protein DAPPUDRAFT_301710 [Daphnia pulex]|eukprot:EFX68034.1 hypothetical protein DAPPUDRAFT_301710 [Daphnia pulex]
METTNFIRFFSIETLFEDGYVSRCGVLSFLILFFIKKGWWRFFSTCSAKSTRCL